VADDVKTAHAHAMDAKEQVFLAQDAISRAWQAAVNAGEDPRGRSTALLRKLEKRLANARHMLEDLDTDYLIAKRKALPCSDDHDREGV
jgi:hypothetical protein